MKNISIFVGLEVHKEHGRPKSDSVAVSVKWKPGAKKHQTIICAIARELCVFMWTIAKEVKPITARNQKNKKLLNRSIKRN